jgi:hypothetical protein
MKTFEQLIILVESKKRSKTLPSHGRRELVAYFVQI